jgi:hypothetical protein
MICQPSGVIYNPAMPERLEADIALLNVADGRPAAEPPPGLASFAPPRKAARGRERDVLFLCLGLRARAPVEAARQAGLLQLAAATFYGTPGSVTAAARQALLAVNQRLLEGNLREGAPVQGGLICAALRGNDFYAVQGGPGLLVVTHPSAVERFPSLPGRPLGLSDVLEAQYFHTLLNAGDYLALSHNARWTEAALTGLGGLATLSAAAERLKAAAGGDFTALVARLEPEGAVSTVPLSAPSAAPAFTLPSLPAAAAGLAERLRRPIAEPAPAEVSGEAAPAADLPAQPVAVEQPPVETPAGTDWRELLRRTEHWRDEPAPAAPPELASDQPASTATPTAPPPAGVSATADSGTDEPDPFTRTAGSPEAGPRLGVDVGAISARARSGLRSFGRALGVTLTEAARSLRRLMARALPEGTLQRDGLFTVPVSVQIGIAVLMPLLVVAVVALIYIQRGQSEQFAEALREVQVEVTQGRLAGDPAAARPHWEAALAAADRAERLRPDDPQVAQLRLEAQGKLDELDWTLRVEYVPLIPGGLGPNARLTQIALAGRDVYVLDAGQNRVWRLTPNLSGVYGRDETFQCGSGVIGEVTIGPLVDLAYLPAPNPFETEAAVVVLDNAGALMYCAPGKAPLGNYLTAPEANWIQPAALELFGDRLYVLDVGANQLWQFPASGEFFNQAPAGYFTSFVYDLRNVVDFTIASGEVVLLRQDGRISLCNRSQPAEAASCVEAAQFTDPRPGQVSGDRLFDLTAPLRLIYDQPPEPAVFALNPANGGLYQLSLKLVFTRQFRPAQTLTRPLSAVAIDPARRFFIATQDNVYVGVRP